MDIYGWLGESLLCSKNYRQYEQMAGEGEREPRTQWEKSRERGIEKAGWVFGRALKEGNIRALSRVKTGTQCYWDRGWNPNRTDCSLNKVHMLILSAVKLQPMQTGRCVRRNRAWAECVHSHKPFIPCLLCLLNTHSSLSVRAQDVRCIIYSHTFSWGVVLYVWGWGGVGGTQPQRESRNEGES